MEGNQSNDDPDVVIISGNIENFLEGERNTKKVINRDEIYDLSEIPQDSNNKLLDEDGSHRKKENPFISFNNFADGDRFENNKDSFEPDPAFFIPDLDHIKKKNEIQENEENEQLNKPNEITLKNFSSNDHSPISKTPKKEKNKNTDENNSPTNKTPKNYNKNNNSPKTHTLKNDDKSSINKTHEPPIISITIAKSAKNITKNEQVKKEKEEVKQELETNNPEEQQFKEKENSHKNKKKEEKRAEKKKKKKKKKQIQRLLMKPPHQS